jgi:hypothetical protein
MKEEPGMAVQTLTRPTTDVRATQFRPRSEGLSPSTRKLVVAVLIVVSVGTKWGLFKYYWIVVKLALTVGTILSGMFLLQELVSRMIAATAGTGPMTVSALGTAPALLIAVSLANVLMLVAATVISVYKPWGTIRRKDRDRSNRSA